MKNNPTLLAFVIAMIVAVVFFVLWMNARNDISEKDVQQEIQRALYRDSLARSDAQLKLLEDSLKRLNPDSLFAVGIQQGQSIKQVYENFLKSRLAARVLPANGALQLFTTLNTDSGFTGLGVGQ